MSPKARASYFGHLWPEACLANEWDEKNEAQRRAVTLECMEKIRAPLTDSVSKLGEAEITALFVYLRHLGDPSSLDKSVDWVSCQEDYKTFALARNADWHERELYGVGKNKWDRNRFKGRTSAAGGALETLDPVETKKRYLTFATRHKAKQRADLQARKLAGGGSEQPSLNKETQPGGSHAPVVTDAKPAETTTETSAAGRSGPAALKVEVPF